MPVLRPIINLLVLLHWQCAFASGLLAPQTQQQVPSQSQLTQAIENNGTLVQALAHMYALQQANAASTSTTANGTTPNSNQFVIKFIHNDSKNNLAYVSIVPVNYTNLHEPRIELRYQSKYPFVSIDERTPNNTVVAAVVVNDEDSGPNGETSLSIEHGNELGHFKLISTQFTNTIQVNGAPLSRHRVPEYNLTIVARDHGSPPKSSAVNLVIKLNTSSPAMGTNAPLEPQPSLKPPVTDLMYLGTMLVVIFSALIILIIIGCALVQRPKIKKGSPSRATSTTTSRIHPSDHCLCPGLTNF